MNEEALRLPTPAADHWETVCRILHEIWGATDTRIRIGGGTILAARWNHRDSTDLDFKLSVPQARIQEHGPQTEHGARLDAAMGTKGYHRTIETSTRLVFEHGPSKMRIDLFESSPAPRPDRARLEAPGWGTVEVLDTDEILDGKIQGRLINPPVRDLFDFAIAARLAPQIWAKAINAAHQDHPRQAIQSWVLQRFHYRALAQTELKGIPNQWAHLGEEAWSHACAAVQHATWPLTTVRYTKAGAVVQGHGPQGVEHEEQPRTDAGALYERLYDLRARLGDRKLIVEYLKQQIERGVRGEETDDMIVKKADVPSAKEEPLLAPAFELLERDLDWKRRQEEKTWPQYRFKEDKEGLTLLVRDGSEKPEKIEARGLSLDALVRLERELRGWPEESEGAIRAFTAQQMQRDRTQGR